jgi:hypothetical protein
MNISGNPQEMKDKELKDAATRFLSAFAASAGSTADAVQIRNDRPYVLGSAGTVELTDAIIDAHSRFVNRAARLLKSKAGHEKAISQIAIDHAHDFVTGAKQIESAVSEMIQAVFDRGNASFEYLAPNYLVKLTPTVKEIRVGRVRALRTQDFSSEWKSLHPDHRVSIVPGKGFSLQITPEIIIQMLPVCWIVKVDAVAENVEEEGKWLIDVAVSFLRLSHRMWAGHFPDIGSIEPHPLRSTLVHKEGVKLKGSKVLAGGSSLPPWYEIDEAVVATSLDKKFVSQAELLCDPPKKSLAERVSQGLGWLTRARQADDRAERLLYFFTAIESLLSTDDKTAPVVQTIARHAAVLLTADNGARAEIAREIKNLYNFRSSLVHAGNRSVLWSGANGAQSLAERLFEVVLEKADLAAGHAIP